MKKCVNCNKDVNIKKDYYTCKVCGAIICPTCYSILGDECVYCSSLELQNKKL